MRKSLIYRILAYSYLFSMVVVLPLGAENNILLFSWAVLGLGIVGFLWWLDKYGWRLDRDYIRLKFARAEEFTLNCMGFSCREEPKDSVVQHFVKVGELSTITRFYHSILVYKKFKYTSVGPYYCFSFRVFDLHAENPQSAHVEVQRKSFEELVAVIKLYESRFK